MNDSTVPVRPDEAHLHEALRVELDRMRRLAADVPGFTLTGDAPDEGGWFCDPCSVYFSLELNACPHCGAPVDEGVGVAGPRPMTDEEVEGYDFERGAAAEIAAERAREGWGDER